MQKYRSTIDRTIRTVLQSGLLHAGIALLRAFGVPINPEQQEAVLAFSAALATVVLAWNAYEDATGRSVLKRG